MRRLAIIGAGGHGRVVAEAALLAGWSEITFYDDHWPKIKKNKVWQIAGRVEDFLENPRQYDGVFVAVGDNLLREKIMKRIIKAGIPIVSIYHPSSVISQFSVIGKGSLVLANSVINPFCNIGDGVIINTSAVVEHDCLIEDFVHISPTVSVGGTVTIRKGSWIGIGSAIKNNVTIEEKAVVGMGAVVTKNVDFEVTVVGIPAKPVSI